MAPAGQGTASRSKPCRIGPPRGFGEQDRWYPRLSVIDSRGRQGAEPIIIVGTGRSGSTFLHRMLARHDDLGWLSTFNEVFPDHLWLSAFSEIYRWPIPDRLKRMKAFPKPFEAYRFWEHYLPGFSRRDRPLTRDDVPVAGIEPVRRATAAILRFQRRRRLLVKVTGWSRMSYFDRIYPGALFISLQRDPRAVVSSWLQAGWLDVTSPPGSTGWQWGDVPPAYHEVWRDLGGGALLSAALKIRLDLDDVSRGAALFANRTYELSYEDLIATPKQTLRSLCAFADLGWTPRFGRIIDNANLYDTTHKWRQVLSEDQGELVLEFFRRTDVQDPSSFTPAGQGTARG